METETEKIIKEQLEYLPEEILSIFANPETNGQILKIGGTAKLNTEQLEIFQTETSLLMLGLTHPDEYQNELKNRLNTYEENLNNITKEIYTLLSGETIEKLKEIYQKTEDKNEREEILSENDTLTTEEIPLPPYAKVIINDQLPINNEGKIPIAPEIPKPTEIVTENISVPIDTDTPKNIIEEKLKSATASDHTVSDYSTPKISTPETEGKPKSFDPYREVF